MGGGSGRRLAELDALNAPTATADRAAKPAAASIHNRPGVASRVSCNQLRPGPRLGVPGTQDEPAVRRLTLPIALTLAISSPTGAGTLPAGSLPPGFPAESSMPKGTLEAAAAALRGGRWELAATEARIALERKGGPEGDRLLLRFVAGHAADQMGLHQQASSAFSAVRSAPDHPLAPWAAWFEARADLERGRPQTALEECELIRKADEKGRFAEECELLGAQALLDLGRVKEASEQFDLWAQGHEGDPRIEGFALSVATALETLGDRDAAARRYRALHIHHRLPTTGASARAALTRLDAAGERVAAFSDDELYARACSLRAAGQRDEAWALWCDVSTRHPSTGPEATALGKRLDDERDAFLWGSQRYLEYAASRLAEWERDKQAPGAPEALYDALTAYSKAGRWDEAIRFQEEGVQRYPKHGRFHETSERSMLLATGGADYPRARAAAVAHRDSTRARKRDPELRLLAAYLAWKAGQLDEARTELDALVDVGEVSVAATFWRSRVHRSAGRLREAASDERAVLERDGDHWYAVVLRSADRRARGEALGPPRWRDGRWPGPEGAPVPAALPAPPAPLTEAMARWGARPMPAWASHPDSAAYPRDRSGRVTTGADGWGRVQIGTESVASPESALPPETATLAPELAPPTWDPGAGLDLGRGHAVLDGLAAAHGEAWPDLRAVALLARAGAVEISGPLFGEIAREIRESRKDRALKKRVQKWKSGGRKADPTLAQAAAALEISLTAGEWLDAHAAAGWIPGVLNLSGELLDARRQPRQDEAARPAWTLLYPAAYADHVWRASWRESIDPLLLLAIMRQESRFRYDARSPVGALGLIQVMPATGSRVAAMLGAVEFHPEHLLRPADNIRLGAFYLGQLMRRFPGQFPLAVASYNGGPHNVGRWLQKKEGRPIEEFVEEIGFGETRDYVKKVCAWYVAYADLYGRAEVHVPERVGPQFADVIDF